MEHLIGLELKKFGVGRNIMFTVAAILFSILFISVSLVDSMTDPEQTKDTFESTFLIIGLLVSSIFLVYSSVLTARFVIGEYDRRTIILLFSYPLNRKGLIAGKMMIIMVYTAVSVMMGYICCTGFMIIADNYFDMLEGTFEISLLQTWIPAVTAAIVCTILSVWPFIIGMIRKSVSATIVSSMIVVVFRQIIISKNAANRESLLQILLAAVITFAIAAVIFKKKVPQLF